MHHLTPLVKINELYLMFKLIIMLVPDENFEQNLTPENLNTYLSEEEIHEYPYLGGYKEFSSPKRDDLTNSEEN
jgi:hypothetical protein